VQDPVLILGATGAIGGAIAKRLAAKGPSFYMEEMKIN